MEFEFSHTTPATAPTSPPVMGKTNGNVKRIPDELIYEVLDGVPVYYKGWQDVLDEKQTKEGIMGYGIFQWLLINLIKDYFQPFFGKNNWLFSGEGGLHISYKTNPSLDFVILPKSTLSIKNLDNKYLDIAPLVVIEVDTKADLSTLPFSPDDYYSKKTKLLLDFGVKEVLWIFTNSQTVILAKKDQPKQTAGWSDEIELLGHRFSINQIIEQSESTNE
jgi:Uma2 family endonuclease